MRRLCAVLTVVALSVSCCSVMSAPRADATRIPKPDCHPCKLDGPGKAGWKS